MERGGALGAALGVHHGTRLKERPAAPRVAPSRRQLQRGAVVCCLRVDQRPRLHQSLHALPAATSVVMGSEAACGLCGSERQGATDARHARHNTWTWPRSAA